MTSTSMRQWHERHGARFGTLNAAEVVLDYGNLGAEHNALRHSVGLLDLSFRGRVCLTGNDRVRFLHGQVTNDVKKLKEGQGCYAALVNAKAKMESDLNIYCLRDELLLDFEPGLTEKLQARFDKFIIADDVQVVDVSMHYGLFSVQGPQAEAALRNTWSNIQIPAEQMSFCVLSSKRAEGGQPPEIYCMRNSRGPAVGFDLFVPLAFMTEVADQLLTEAEKVGGRICGWTALDTVRVEAGIPRFGQDMDETNLAPEAGVEARAISYTKGCYIGQEVISRIRTYGQVAKILRGLFLSATKREALPTKGDKIFLGDKEAGYITSAVHSPTLNANIALGYVRREHNEIGTELLVQSRDQRIPARIVPLPFV